MELLLIVLAAAGGVFGAKRWRDARTLRRERQEELEGVQRLADEDVIVLGEQLQRLGREVEGHELDEETRISYQTALDAYESAQRAVPRIKGTDEISKIVDTLSSGRYALACVQARVAGGPVPERRVSCFFNPQHGPSSEDVRWTQPGRGTRIVPACAQDAARVANQETPEVRTVKVGSRDVPYWEAGLAYVPYGEGYFGGSALMIWAFHTDLGSSQGYGYGHGGGFDGGGFDGGGHDGGGFGGFDGGGGG